MVVFQTCGLHERNLFRNQKCMFITRTNDTLPSVKCIYTSNTLVLYHHVEQHVKHGSELYLLGTQI